MTSLYGPAVRLSSERRLFLACLLALVCGAALLRLFLGAGAAAEDPITPEFRRAMKLYLDPDPARRSEGEKQIRALGARAVPQLEAWISRSEGDLDRARALLSWIGGGASKGDDLLAAARPFFVRETSAAWKRFRDGQYREAQRRAEAILRLDPEFPESWQLRRLVKGCEERILSKEVLEPIAEFREMVYGLDESPRLIFRLVNRSKLPITVRAERGVLGSLQLIFERRFIDGSTRADERPAAIRTFNGEERFVLQPGEAFERDISVYIDEPKPLQGMVLRIRAQGKFQPSQWNMEEKNISRTIALIPAECWVVPPAEKNLADSPLRKLKSSLFFRDLQGFFTGGNLGVWAGEEDPALNEGLLGIIVESLGDLDETGMRVAEDFLERAGGSHREKRGGSLEEIAGFWRKWWAERKRNEPVPRAEKVPRPGLPEE